MSGNRRTATNRGDANLDALFRNQAAVDEIVDCVRRGKYCTILGPRYCRKSLLLQHVRESLEASGGDHACISVDLAEYAVRSDSELLAEFGTRIASAAGRGAGSPPTSELGLKTLLQALLDEVGSDLVLLIDHLEQIPVGPVTALLRALRAVFTERGYEDPHRVVAVVASSLSVAELSLGEQSPFNIAHPVLVEDLTPAESDRLIDAVLGESGAEIDAEARAHLREITQGDRYLIPKLCRRCLERLAQETGTATIHKADVDGAEEWFLSSEAENHPPLRETTRALEGSPTNLLNTIKVLDGWQVAGRELEIDLNLEINSLQLTGAIRKEDGGLYRIRNNLYRRYLARHFHPQRVVHVLRLSGEWGKAVTYLESRPGEELTGPLREAFSSSVVESIYASRDLARGADGVAGRISKAFELAAAAIYVVDFSRSQLERISHAGEWADLGPAETVSLTERDRPEVRAYFDPPYRLDQTDLWVQFRTQEDVPFGIAVLRGLRFEPQDDDFLALLAFLKQVGWAMARVRDRERKALQLSTLAETGQQVARSLDLDQVVRETVDAGIKAVPGAQRGVLFLWDAEQELLRIAAQHGYRSTIAEEVTLKEAEGYVGQVFRTGQGLRIDDAQTDPKVVLRHDPDVQKQRAVVCVPLVAWGRPFGVFCVDSTTSVRVFNRQDEDLLATFAAQASVAIQNARLSRELYLLGMEITRGDRKLEEITRHVVEAITRVSAAKGANLLLLRETYDPYASLAQKPTLSASHGLGADYSRKVQARKNGLTFRILQERKPSAVSHPEDPPGINEAALEIGIRAYLGLPIMAQNRILGVLFVHYEHPRHFSESEVEMLMLFANLCAMAIENARRRDQLRISASVAWMGIELSDMGHEITQKVSAIHNTLFGLRAVLPDDPQTLAKIVKLEEYAQKIADIPARTLAPFRDRVGRFDLNRVLREEVQRWSAAHRSLELIWKLVPGDAPVAIDRQRFAVVPKTLTTNAVRAMTRVPVARLRIASKVREGRVIVDFANTGPQIPAGIQELLFHEPVSQADGAEGTGVGLLIARSVMLGCGGDLELLDSTAEETTFRLWLPHAIDSGDS